MLDASHLTSANLATHRSLEDRVRFHAPHLERVSRSFAYGISRLELDLRAPIGLGYLICRILDTIEDAPWPSGEDQEIAFREFAIFLRDGGRSPEVMAAWMARFPTTIADGERALVNDAQLVFAEFASQGAREKAAMLNPVMSMSRGMRAFTERKRQTGELRLRHLNDVNAYCFFVAGVVGELLTGLLPAEILKEMRPIGRETIWELATQFGLFLQKINLLKDQETDEREGRFLIPDREELLRSLATHADGAFAYLQTIPLQRRDYRLFCAWALYLGLATIPVLRNHGSKISRLEALALGAKIEFAIQDNARLSLLFRELANDAWPSNAASSGIPQASSQISPQILLLLEQNYVGEMKSLELARLLTQGPV